MKEKTALRILLPALAASLLQSGCLAPQGILFTRVTEPLALPSNRKECPLADKKCYVSLTQLKEPVTRINLSVMWSNNVVREAAHAAGMNEIYYTDLETLSIFMGTYKRQRVIFHGK